MYRAFFACLLACAVLATPTSAQSIVPSDGQNPAQVEQLGYPTNYSATGITPGFPFTIAWTWRQVDVELPDPFPAENHGSTFLFDIPGQFEIECVVTYGSVSNPNLKPPGPQTITKTVMIQPPTLKAIVPSVLAAPYAATPGQYAPSFGPNQVGESEGQWVYFVLQSNGKPIGPANGLGGQERLTNVVLFHRFPQDPSPWRPGNPNATDPRNQGTDSCFGVIWMGDGNFAIEDFKTTDCSDPGYTNSPGDGAGIPPHDNVVLEYDQEVRAQWTDRSGQLRQSPVIHYAHWTFYGQGDGTWQDDYKTYNFQNPNP